MKCIKNIVTFIFIILVAARMSESSASAETWHHKAADSTGSISVTANKSKVNGYYPKDTIFTLHWTNVFTNPDYVIGSGGLAYGSGYLHVGFANSLAIPNINNNTHQFVSGYATEAYHGHIIHEDTSSDIWQEYWAAKASSVTTINNSDITFSRNGSSIGTTDYNTWNLTYQTNDWPANKFYIFIADRAATSGTNDYAFAYKSLGSIPYDQKYPKDENPPVPDGEPSGTKDVNINNVTYYKESNMGIDFTITDDKSGVQSLSLLLPNHATYTNYSGSSLVGSNVTYKTISVNTSDTINGTFTYSYYATDGVNNVSSIIPKSFNVDGSAPLISDLSTTATSATVTATDTQIGLNTFILQKNIDGTWADKQTINLSGEVTGVTKTFTENDYGNYRIACYDKFGYVSYSDEFELGKLVLDVSLSKVNGDIVGADGTLDFKQYGDMVATVQVNLTGNAQKVKYDIDSALNGLDSTVPTSETHDLPGTATATDSFFFTIPEGVQLNHPYAINVTGIRGTKTVTKTVYVEVIPIDSSKLHSIITYQSGMSN